MSEYEKFVLDYIKNYYITLHLASVNFGRDIYVYVGTPFKRPWKIQKYFDLSIRVYTRDQIQYYVYYPEIIRFHFHNKPDLFKTVFNSLPSIKTEEDDIGLKIISEFSFNVNNSE